MKKNPLHIIQISNLLTNRSEEEMEHEQVKDHHRDSDAEVDNSRGCRVHSDGYWGNSVRRGKCVTKAEIVLVAFL